MCKVKGCKQEDVEVTYYGRDICMKCWNKHCDERKTFNLKELFNIKPEVIKPPMEKTYVIPDKKKQITLEGIQNGKNG